MKFVQQTWEWLASRLPARTIWHEEHQPVNRPSLPAAELLGDRILLDGVQVSSEVQIKGETDAAILIGMIKGEFDLVKLQLDTLGIAAKIGDIKVEFKEEILKKLSSEWLDVNEVLLKWGQGLIKGELGEKKIAEFGQKLAGELKDVSDFAVKLDPSANGLLLPAVQKVNAAAIDIFAKLGDIKGESEIKWQEEHILQKVADAFSKMDDILLKLAVHVLTDNSSIKGEIKGELKITEYGQKATDYLLKLDDPALQGLLLPAVQKLAVDFDGLFKALTEPPENPDGGGDLGGDGGITILVESTDDLISEA